ncbi:MAG: hypothetical protein ABGW98_02410, partial [Myxococcales bacterium]
MSEDQDEAPASGRALKIVGIIAAVVVFYFLTRQLGGYIPELQAQIKDLGPLGPVVFIVSYAVGVLAFLPGAALTLTGGALFDLVEGTIYVFTAAVIGSGLAFLAARHLARSFIEEKL